MNKTDIINSALNLLNGREIIDFNEDSEEARIARRYYETALYSILTIEKWKCSVRFKKIPRVIGKDPIFGFEFVYEIPKNIVKIIQFYLNDHIGEQRVDYILSGNLLYTSSETVAVECVEVIDPEDMTPMMTEVFILKLASLMAPILTDVGSGLRVDYMQQIDLLIDKGINELDYSLDNDENTKWREVIGGNYDL